MLEDQWVGGDGVAAAVLCWLKDGTVLHLPSTGQAAGRRGEAASRKLDGRAKFVKKFLRNALVRNRCGRCGIAPTTGHCFFVA